MTIHEKLLAILREHFTYDPDTGIFTRISRKGGEGSFDSDGYLILKIKTKQYKAHRMAWLYVYGRLPKYNIDHINGNRSDNRIANLRDVPQAVNVQNTRRKPNPETGVVGVYIDRTNGLKKKFALKHKGRSYRFYTLEDAVSFSNLCHAQAA